MAYRSNSVGSAPWAPQYLRVKGAESPTCCHLSRAMWPLRSCISKEQSSFSIYGKSVETETMNDLNIPVPHSLYTGNPLEPKRSPTVLG